ncbi:MAG TPA: hypothetical protein VJA21_23505 [Verrucomicrobiae bacterium]
MHTQSTVYGPESRRPLRWRGSFKFRISDFGFRISIVAVLSLFLLPRSALSGLPQPMYVYYGQALDGYGLPYRTNADIILFHGTNEIARQTIRGSLTPGVNFALYVHLDDGRSAVPYSRRALQVGDLVRVMVRDQEGLKIIMEEQAVPPVGQPGELVFIDATAATDLDRDGLPDRWEYELIAWSGGALHTLTDVRPEDDFDGDGMTNLEEYRSGTFAFLPYDYLYIERYEPTPNNRLRLTFLSVPGKAYSVGCATNVMQAAWQPSPFAASDTGAFQETPVEGNGDWLSLYAPIDPSTWFFRLEVR